MDFLVRKDELENFAAEFWKAVGPARVFAFHGAMGAGKTTTITALVHYKGVQDTAGSPTFSIINEYVYGVEGQEKIYHIDLYRLKDAEEMDQAGVEDCITSGAYCFVEWPEKGPQLFDEESLHITIDLVDDATRRVTIYRSEEWEKGNVREQL